jgi:hypothetical protein
LTIEDIGGPSVLERIEQNADQVFRGRGGRPAEPHSLDGSGTVVSHGVGRDPSGFGVETENADVEIGVVVKNADFGPFRRFVAGPRFDHEEARDGDGRFPGLVVEKTIDLGALLDPDGPDLGGGEEDGGGKDRRKEEKGGPDVPIGAALHDVLSFQ